MAENSLFAILLRSRWWVSFLVGAAWALLAAALVPQPYKMIAILGSLPFWAVGFVAFVRQYDQPTPAAAAAPAGDCRAAELERVCPAPGTRLAD